MKKWILALFLGFSLTGFAQEKPAKALEAAPPAVRANQYVIQGQISGYPDGTTVDLLNASNGAPENTTKITNGQFTLTGSVEFPDLKFIAFNKVQPFVPVFLDNSQMQMTGSKEAIDKAQIRGSKNHDDFMAYSAIARPYEKIFSGQEQASEATLQKAASEMEQFAKINPNSYISLLAIYRNFQLSSDADKMDQLFTGLNPSVKSSPMGNYIQEQLNEAKRLPMGKPLADFTQEDENGKPVSLSSFRGKYVLVDFWASWCGPCRQENPNVVAAYQKYKNNNFTVLGVSLDKDKEKWLKAVADDKLTWMQLSDLKGWQNAVAQQFNIGSIPQNFLIDPNGVLIGKNLRGAALESKLASIFKK